MRENYKWLISGGTRCKQYNGRACLCLCLCLWNSLQKPYIVNRQISGETEPKGLFFFGVFVPLKFTPKTIHYNRFLSDAHQTLVTMSDTSYHVRHGYTHYSEPTLQQHGHPNPVKLLKRFIDISHRCFIALEKWTFRLVSTFTYVTSKWTLIIAWHWNVAYLS